MNLIKRAQAYAPLTPTERAILKLGEGLLAAALIAALPIVAGALGGTRVNWADVARAALGAAGVAALLALVKYAKAHGDPAIQAVAAEAEQLVEQKAATTVMVAGAGTGAGTEKTVAGTSRTSAVTAAEIAASTGAAVAGAGAATGPQASA